MISKQLFMDTFKDLDVEELDSEELRKEIEKGEESSLPEKDYKQMYNIIDPMADPFDNAKIIRDFTINNWDELTDDQKLWASEKILVTHIYHNLDEGDKLLFLLLS